MTLFNEKISGVFNIVEGKVYEKFGKKISRKDKKALKKKLAKDEELKKKPVEEPENLPVKKGGDLTTRPAQKKTDELFENSKVFLDQMNERAKTSGLGDAWWEEFQQWVDGAKKAFTTEQLQELKDYGESLDELSGFFTDFLDPDTEGAGPAAEQTYKDKKELLALKDKKERTEEEEQRYEELSDKFKKAPAAPKDLEDEEEEAKLKQYSANAQKYLAIEKPYILLLPAKISDEKTAKEIKALVTANKKQSLPFPVKKLQRQLHSYVVSWKLVKDLKALLSKTDMGGAQIPFLLAPVDLSDKEPFSNLTVPIPLAREVGLSKGDIVGGLNDRWGNLLEEIEGDEGSRPALRMPGGIPIQYTRFLSETQGEWKYLPYERDGVTFVFCTQEEFKSFLKEMALFKQPSYFYEDLTFVGDIPGELKRREPQTYKSPNCIVLTAKEKLSVSEKGDTAEDTLKRLIKEYFEKMEDGTTNAAAVFGGDEKKPKDVLEKIKESLGVSPTDKDDIIRSKAEKYFTDKKTDNKDLVYILPAVARFLYVTPKEDQLLPYLRKVTDEGTLINEVVQLGFTEKEAKDYADEAFSGSLGKLNDYAITSLGSLYSNPGAYIKGRVIGSLTTNFNVDHTKAILWGSTYPIPLSEEQIRKDLPFIKKADLRFSSGGGPAKEPVVEDQKSLPEGKKQLALPPTSEAPAV